MKNIIIALLVVSTATAAFFAYQNQQKIVAMNVLLEDKSKQIATLESTKADLDKEIDSLQSDVAKYKAEEAERAAKEAAQNAATVSDADLKSYGTPCKDWIAENFGDRDYPAYSKTYASIQDSWMKNGKYVFEIAVPSDLGSSSNSVFLCIFDKAKQNMFKPSVYDMNNWRRSQ